MKICICIPIYNFDVTTLVGELIKAINNTNFETEIKLIDDASDYTWRNVNGQITSPYVEYIQLEKNIGRSKIRNLFLNYSQADYFLYLDCDSYYSFDIHNNILTNYENALKINSEKEVIVGGRIYPQKSPSNKQHLAWKLGVIREAKPAKWRNLNKALLLSNNFLIKRDLFLKIQFDERILNYGNEDSILSVELLSRGHEIFHIDNPIMNNSIDDVNMLLKKCKITIMGLIELEKNYSRPELLEKYIKIIRIKNKCLRHKLAAGILFYFFKLFNPIVKRILLARVTSLYLLDLYKLGFYIVKSKEI